MPNQHRLDKAILAVVGERQPISLNNIMTHLDSDHIRDGRSMRTAKDRVYTLRREGMLVQVGIGQNTTYALPDYDTATTEAQRQAAEARTREADPIPSASVVVDDDLPEGWRTLREQLHAQQTDWAHEEPLTTITQPAPFRIEISALAGDVAAHVAMTVERVVGQSIKRYEGVIADMQRQLAAQVAETERLREELQAAEQLGSEAESKYNELREKLRAL